MLSLRYCVVAAASFMLPAAALDVLVVAASGTGDFTQVQAAVDAAVDGDTILVESGHYGPVVVTSKGLSIVADPSATIHGGLRFENTLEHQALLVTGLTLRGTKPLGDPEGVPALTLSVVRGPVRIQDCELIGAAAPGNCSWPPAPLGDCAGGPAARVRFGLDVAFSHCTIRGGAGAESLTGDIHNAGGHGLIVEAGNVALHDCTVLGGDGWSSEHMILLDEGGRGGDAVRAADTATVPLHLSINGSLLVGGDGGDGDLCICRAGAGGDGLRLSGATARIERLDSNMAGGAAGCGGNNPQPGVPLRLEAGAVAQTFAGTARSLLGPTPIREGAAGTLLVVGEPGDIVVLLRAHSASFTPRPMWSGVFLLGVPSFQSFEVLGTIPGSGVLLHVFSAGALRAGDESGVGYRQMLLRDVGGVGWLSGPWTQLTLDASF